MLIAYTGVVSIADTSSAADLTTLAIADFIGALAGQSAGVRSLSRGLHLSFDCASAVAIPAMTVAADKAS